ncbi:MAG: glutamate 5-kinase [Deltaproteobacteria bacterium]|jgi:glutamate 5-kinase|nr:glutamate 5-kinase [Deltaproteobacteria bacterium]
MSRDSLKKTRRLVVKVGSQLTCGQGLEVGRLKAIAKQLAQLRREGRECLLVTSGAVALGYKRLGLAERPTTLRLKQASAAAGQVALMVGWEKALEAYGLKAAQILLTAEDLADRARFLNAKNTFATLIELGAIPVVNENDTVAVAELKVGDNDTLGSLVASLCEADLFINLTDQDGLFEADPKERPEAAQIFEIAKVTPEILALAGGSGPLGTGGMFTKVQAAGRLAERGLPSIIANGLTRDILLRLLAGERLGTYFPPLAKRRPAYKHWLAFAARPKGKLLVDAGAALALQEKGKSLLPGGILAVEGLFSAGDAVAISLVGQEPFGVGLVNYSAPEVGQILGLSSQQIESRLGYSHSDEIIHRDNLVVFGDPPKENLS